MLPITIHFATTYTATWQFASPVHSTEQNMCSAVLLNYYYFPAPFICAIKQTRAAPFCTYYPLPFIILTNRRTNKRSRSRPINCQPLSGHGAQFLYRKTPKSTHAYHLLKRAVCVYATTSPIKRPRPIPMATRHWSCSATTHKPPQIQFVPLLLFRRLHIFKNTMNYEVYNLQVV